MLQRVVVTGGFWWSGTSPTAPTLQETSKNLANIGFNHGTSLKIGWFISSDKNS
jgi:hypothetical protein